MKKVILYLLALIFLPIPVYSAPQDYGVDYDIVYIRYAKWNRGEPPSPDDLDPLSKTGSFVNVAQGGEPDLLMPGADLMLLKPDGTQEVIVDCDFTCSVIDPYMSFDATTVYYSKAINTREIVVASDEAKVNRTERFIFKVDISGGAPYTEVQLTYPGSFDTNKYKAAIDSSHSISNYGAPGTSNATPMQDLTPVPLSNGKILFTSNRAGLINFDNYNQAETLVQQMYVMDDHDGSKNTAELANIKRIENSNLVMVQHPIQLKDGRILYSQWINFGNKPNYASMELFTMHPDGSNLQQFTEPHDHQKNVVHWITQLSNTDVVGGVYYNSYDYGFGVLAKWNVTDHNGTFIRNDMVPKSLSGFELAEMGNKEFQRADTVLLTPHTTPADVPAPNRSGKYAMPAWAPNGDMLVAYSTGYVNHFSAVCRRDAPDYKCEQLKSGIYLHQDAITTVVTDPTDTSRLSPMIDDPEYNELQPRAVVTYNAVFGQEKPDIIPSVRESDNYARLAKGEVSAILGTSSMLLRETKACESCGDDHDVLIRTTTQRERAHSPWIAQGTEVGVFNDSEVYGVRILLTPENVSGPQDSVSYASRGKMGASENNYHRFSPKQGFGGNVTEQWKILGEFPLTHKDVTDPQGNPDTSWKAKIPAETPTTIQAIDVNGMTLYSEQVWRSLSPGEEKTDCGGCHAHSTNVEPLAWELSEAGKGSPISGALGVSDTDPRIKDGMWDMTTGTIPLLGDNGAVEWVSGNSYSVEWYRDIEPILESNCNSCHTNGGSNGGLILDYTGPTINLPGGRTTPYDPYLRLVMGAKLTDFDKNSGIFYNMPQTSKYIRAPQAKNSMFVWVAYGQRMDGRTNSTLEGDVDYPDAHPVVSLTSAEKRTLSRWVDLGAPVDLLDYDVPGHRYTDDLQLPHVEIFSPRPGYAHTNQKFRFGVMDAQSGIDWSQLSITWWDTSTPGTVNTISTYKRDSNGVVIADLPSMTQGNEYTFKVHVKDVTGNIQEAFTTITAGTAAVTPSAINNVNVSVQ